MSPPGDADASEPELEELFRTEIPFRPAYRLLRASFGFGAPHVVVVAGVHGNELTAILAANQLCRTLSVSPPPFRVSVVPCLNTPAAEEGRRRWPFDDRDVYDALPGDPSGLPIERVAESLMRATEADFGVDLQCGSLQMFETPHVRAPADEPRARATGLPWWPRPAQRLVAAWRARGQAGLVLRGGQSGAVAPGAATPLVEGLLALLRSFVEPAPDRAGNMLAGPQEYRARRGGLFLPEVTVGQDVGEGARLGVITQLVGGQPVESVHAVASGRVFGLRTWPVVHGQELLVRTMDMDTG